MYSYESESMFECSKTFSIVFIGLILMTAGFCLTMAGWFAPPINNFVLGVRMAGPVTLLVGLVILLCSCLMCAIVQRKCCVCCFDFLDRRKARRKRDSGQQIVTNPHNPLIFDDMQDSVSDCRRMQSEYYFDTSASTKGRGNGYFRGENTNVVGLSENDEEYFSCMVVRNDSAKEGTPATTPTVKVKVRKVSHSDMDYFYDQNDVSLDLDSTVHVNAAVATSPRRSSNRTRSSSAERRSKSASPSRRPKPFASQTLSDSERKTCNGPCSQDKNVCDTAGESNGCSQGIATTHSDWSYHPVTPKSPEQLALELEVLRRHQQLTKRERPKKRNRVQKELGSFEEVWQQKQPGLPSARPSDMKAHAAHLVMEPRLHPSGQQMFRAESRAVNNGQLAASKQCAASVSVPRPGSTSPRPAVRTVQQNIVLPKPGQFRERDPNRLTPREQRRRRIEAADEDETTPLNPGHSEPLMHGSPLPERLPLPPPAYADAVVVHSNV